MDMIEACNLNVPAGATPMTIADAIIRANDKETLEEVLYYIDCFLEKNGYKDVCSISKRAKGKWHSNGLGTALTCSICESTSPYRLDFCPNCGADMTESENK